MGLVVNTITIFLSVLTALLRRNFARAFVLWALAVPVYWYVMPPVSCGGCMPGIRFRRCDSGLRYQAALKSDLKNLASMQEIHFSEHGQYTSDPVALGFTHSDGVEVTIVAAADRWAATTHHVAVGDRIQCGIRVGERFYESGLMAGEEGALLCSVERER